MYRINRNPSAHFLTPIIIAFALLIGFGTQQFSAETAPASPSIRDSVGCPTFPGTAATGDDLLELMFCFNNQLAGDYVINITGNNLALSLIHI